MHRAILLVGLGLFALLFVDAFEDDHYTPFPVLEGRFAGSWRMSAFDRWDLEDGEESLADVRIDIERVLAPYRADAWANGELDERTFLYAGTLTIGDVPHPFALRAWGRVGPTLVLQDSVSGNGPIERRIREGLSATMQAGATPDGDELMLGFAPEPDGSVYPLLYRRVVPVDAR